MGLYVKSSEALNVVGNAVHGNKGAGVSVLQSGQLTRLVANCVCGNARTGVSVETGCQVELRGNGVYDNGGHGVSCRGDGQVTENDVVGNRGSGIRLAESADVKVSRVAVGYGCGRLTSMDSVVPFRSSAPSPAVPLAPGPEEPRPGGAGVGHRSPGPGEGAGAGERGVSEPARQHQAAPAPRPRQRHLPAAQQHPAALHQEKARGRSAECCRDHTWV